MRWARWCLMTGAAVVMIAAPMFAVRDFAQVTPAAGYTPPDDTPSFKVGTVIFTDYTYVDEPTSTDTDGNVYHPASFNVSRAYINITGNLNHLIGFRVTPDITRPSTSTTLDGSLVFRLKYAYAQFSLDQSVNKGSWIRFGEHQTPYVVWLEDVYRYRFQGPIFVDAESKLSSSDFGGSFHYNFPASYGDLHVGYYNGDTYSSKEPNDQKAVQLRASFRPAPMTGVIKGLRLTGFYDSDHYMKNDDKTRTVLTATFEHRFVSAGYEHLDATDQTTGAAAKLKANGYSVWATPKFGKGFEGLLRFDSLKPDKTKDDTKDRTIVGAAYWFKIPQGSGTAALLLDYTKVQDDTPVTPTTDKRYALHTQFTF